MFRRYGTLGILLLLIFIMGFFLEWVEISFIVLPLFAPIVAGLDFGLGISQDQQLFWFAMPVAVNLQTSFLTPPFGYSLISSRAWHCQRSPSARYTGALCRS